MKKLLIALLVTAVLAVAFAVPALADQPDDPGGFGKAMGEEAQSGEFGLSTMIHEAQDFGESEGITLGEQVTMALEILFGIPPAHTP